jgi:type I restriction enzyme M protein
MIEQDTRFIIDSVLTNKGWILDINRKDKNVFFESDILRIVDNLKLKKSKKRPDYVLVDRNKKPIAIIEAKAGGKDLDKALDQAEEYAEMLNIPLIFAMNNSYCQTRFLKNKRPLFLNGEEVNELLRQAEALKFLEEDTNEIYTIPKETIASRHELINIFKNLNNTLRSEGLRAGIERLTEFANILFLKLYTENKADNVWYNLKNTDNDLLFDTFKSSLKHIEKKYNVEVFSTPQITNPETLKDIIYKLDKLTLSAIDTDIKGDSFEYFLKQATATNNDLGEYFTPRHIVKTMVNLINPRFREKVYDPFCGTGGFLTEAFQHIKDNTIINKKEDEKILRQETIFGGEITTNAKLAKMNMILHGDGHSGVKKIDSLANPIENKYDVVITNMPFSQKITKKVWNKEKGKEEVKNLVSPLYENSLAKNNGDGVCLLHCFKAVKKGGRMAVVVPDGVLFKSDLKAVRKFLLNNAVLKTVVSLPVGVFEPYAVAKTSILYFINCHNGKTKDDVWYFDVENDGYSLDSYRRKTDKNDLKKVEYLDFNKKQEKKNFLEIGFKNISLSEIKEKDYNLVSGSYKTETTNNKHKMVKLGDICKEENIRAGKNWKNYPVCTISSRNGGIVKQEEYFKKSVASQNREKYKIIKPKFFGYRPPGLDIGTIGYNNSNEEVAVSPIYVIFSCNEKVIYLDFLLKVFHSDYFKNIVKPMMIGTARPSVSFNQFKEIRIPIPPLNIQKNIIEKNKKIEKDINTKINSILNQI